MKGGPWCRGIVPLLDVIGAPNDTSPLVLTWVINAVASNKVNDKTAIMPVLEYACPAWHNSLNTEQSSRIESVQKRAIKIIYGHGDYSDICVKQGLPTLASRRTEMCTSFFNNSVLKKNSCLHYLLPRPRRRKSRKN